MYVQAGTHYTLLFTGVTFSWKVEEGRQLQRGGGWSELGPEGARPEPSSAAMRPEGLNPHLLRTLAWQQPICQFLNLPGEG